MALSQTRQVAYNMVTMGSGNVSGHLVSRGVSMGAGEDKSLCRQALTPLKPRGGVVLGRGLGDPGEDVESDFSCAACLCSSAL